jgi:hypothetical protein
LITRVAINVSPEYNLLMRIPLESLLACTTPMNVVLAILFAGMQASAQIAIEQVRQIPGNAGSNMVQAFQVNQVGSVLVVGLYQDGTTVNYVRFGDGGGVGSGDQAADAIIAQGRAAIAYFLNPSTDPGLSIRLGNGANGFIGAWELTGVDLIVAPDSSTTDSITSSQDDMFIVSWASKNGNGNITPANGAMSVDINLFQDGGTGSGSGGSLAAPTAGSYAVGWNNDDAGFGPFALAFATAAAGSIAFTGEAASAITANSATLSTNLVGAADVTAYWEAGAVADPSTHIGWDGSNGPSAETTGTVSRGATGLTADTLYSFAYYGNNGNEQWSAVATFPTSLTNAQAPSFTGATQAEAHLAVDLTWTDNSNTETAFQLLRADDGVTFSTVATIAANATSYRDPVPAVGTYTYRLSAANSINGSATDPALAQTSLAVTVPDFGVAQLLQIPGNGGGNIAQPFQVSQPASVLVVTIYQDGNTLNYVRFGNGGGVGSGDQAADGIFQQDRGAIAYFLNPSTAAGLAIRMGNGSAGFIAAWELAGVDLSIAPDSSDTDSITTSQDDMFIASWASQNGEADLASANGAMAIDITLFKNGTTGSGAGGSLSAPTAGSYNVGWSADNANYGPHALAFAKAPPDLVAFTGETASVITSSSATLAADLAGTADVTVYWEAGAVADPSTHVGWDGSNGPSAQGGGPFSLGATGLTADTLYRFAFYGNNAGAGTEGWSGSAATFPTAMTNAQAPAFTGATQSATRLAVTLTWTDNSATETGFELQRADDGVTFTTVATTAANAVSHTDVVPVVATYTYRLSAVNSINGSATDPALAQTSIVVAAPDFGVAQVIEIPNALGGFIQYPFQVDNPNSVLVVGIYRDGTTFDNIRFGDGGGIGSGDQAADAVITDNRGALAYFLNPSTAAGLSIRVDPGGNGTIGAWVLSGVKLAGTINSSTSDTITTTKDNMFVVGWGYRNGSGVLSPNGALATPLDLSSHDAGAGTGSAAGSSLLAPTAGAYNVSWNNDDVGSPLSFAFEAQPGGTVVRIR